MSTKKTAPRWMVTADGVWTGGSYATKPEADRAARLVRQQRPEQKIKVEPKGRFIADQTAEEPEATAAPESPEASSSPTPPETPPPAAPETSAPEEGRQPKKPKS